MLQQLYFQKLTFFSDAEQNEPGQMTCAKLCFTCLDSLYMQKKGCFISVSAKNNIRLQNNIRTT